MKKANLKWILAATVSAAMLAACGGGSDVVPATTATSTSITAANAAALAGTPYIFDSGVTQFGTTSSTSLTVAGSGAATTFAIASAGKTASGVMSFGSCIFTVTKSDFPLTDPLGLGKVITINPCAITINSTGYPVGTQSIPTTLTLGTLVSSPNSKTVTVSVGGQNVIGTVVVTGGAK